MCIINKDENEGIDSLTDRGWFIVSQKPKKDEELKNLQKYSKLWFNINNLKCKYDSEIHFKINDMEKNLN